MNYSRFARLSVVAAVLCAAGLASTLEAAMPARAAVDGTQIQKIVDSTTPAIVTLKFILKGGEQDEEVETTGIVIDPAGLILTNNNAFGGLMARFGGPTPTPSEIKVLVGDDTQGVDATFMARDSELGLAWVKLAAAPAKPLAFVDLSKSAPGSLGQDLVEVSLMGKFFDRAPVVSTASIAAVVKKPRELYIPSIGLAIGEMGMPVFNEKGDLLGITTLILPDQEEVMGSSGGMRAAMRGITGGMILPAAEAMAATTRAKETAAAGKTEDAKPADGKGEEPKKDEGQMDEGEKPK
jgi:S1-C subfamily serine protease